MRWGCGCGSFRAGVRVISGFSRLLRAAVWPPGTAVIISRPCWYSLGSGATLRTCRRRFRGQPEGWFLTDSPWDDEVIIGRPGVQAKTTPSAFPSRGGSRWEWPGSTAGGWGRWPTARRGTSWPARWDGHWWTRGCICPRVGPRTKTGVRRRVCRRIGRATGPRRSWPWRWWGGHRSGAT